jgi:tyrosyl-tRNA synthetase
LTGSGTKYGPVLDDLLARDLVATCSDERGLRARLEAGPTTLYCGYDPTADSLHVGHLISVRTQMRFALSGHPIIVVVGGATGMIGDPSGRSEERNLLDAETLDANRNALHAQITRLLDGVDQATVTVVDNRDWFEPVRLLDFLRDVGKLVPITDMLERSSVKTRLQSQAGLSFTEFSYQLLQAYDFVHLRRELNCELQIGGSDQYGNIIAGIDMIRRRGLGHAFGLVWPLMTKADGAKFGKSADGNVWLNSSRTSPYAFHHFWLNTDDADVSRLLAQFTLMPLSAVNDLMTSHERAPNKRAPQVALADALTTWVHGPAACESVNKARAALFGETELDRDSVQLLAREIPCLHLPRADLTHQALDQIIMRVGLSSSVSDARRLVTSGGIYVDGVRATDPTMTLTPPRQWILLGRGRSTHGLVLLTD